MIYLFFGENSYARDQALAEVLGNQEAEKIDGEMLDLRDLPDLLLGQTLFASQRLIVIRNLAENTVVWNELEKYLEKIPEETTVIFAETKPDKRTKTYKLLRKLADVREFALPKNIGEATAFALEQSKIFEMKLDTSTARHIVERVGLEPWNVVHALEKLSLADDSSTQAIDQLIEDTPEAQVFGLFEAALARKPEMIHAQIATLSLSENPHLALGFLTSQALQLAALRTAPDDAKVANDIGAHPFALSKLAPYAKKMSRADVRLSVSALAECDEQLKSSAGEPWTCIEVALQRIATR